MNNVLIEKLIKSNNDVCPEFTYTNPLLDRNVARALSKSLVKILKVSTQNSNVNNNLRISVLENIRKLCKVHPENHLKVDESITELLTDSYEKLIQESIEDNIDNVDIKLEKFFIRNYKEVHINLSTKYSFNPEIIQALINLNTHEQFFNTLSKTVMQWNVNDSKYLLLAQELWNSNNIIANDVSNDLSIKLKSNVETLLLEISCTVLEKPDYNYEFILSSFPQFKNLIKICSTSCDCFQICCSIFNFILIISKFAPQIQNLIQSFIKDIKLYCMDKTISVLYPIHLIPTVILLDIDISILPTTLKDCYIQSALKYLRILQNGFETDLILLLSHFPDWFDIYFR